MEENKEERMKVEETTDEAGALEELKEPSLEEKFEETEKIADEKGEEIISAKADEELKDEERILNEETKEERFSREAAEKLEMWVPRTQLGKEVKSGKIKTIDKVFEDGRKILEPQIVDILIPNLISDNLFIGQAKGKFGGGKRRAFRQTQKKTKEGNVLTFGVMTVVGDGDGHVGVGYGKASETLPAKEKAIRKAKLNIHKVHRGCASYDCSCDEPHSIPVATSGKCSSVRVKLIPAPQGTGLVIGDEIKKILRAAGIRDIYSQCSGKVKTTFNTAKACMRALDKLGEIKV